MNHSHYPIPTFKKFQSQKVLHTRPSQLKDFQALCLNEECRFREYTQDQQLYKQQEIKAAFH